MTVHKNCFWKQDRRQWATRLPCTTSNSTFGDRSFAAAGPRTWNELPFSLRDTALSLTTFNEHLKTYLFFVAFWDHGAFVTFYDLFAPFINLLTYFTSVQALRAHSSVWPARKPGSSTLKPYVHCSLGQLLLQRDSRTLYVSGVSYDHNYFFSLIFLLLFYFCLSSYMIVFRYCCIVDCWYFCNACDFAILIKRRKR